MLVVQSSSLVQWLYPPLPPRAWLRYYITGSVLKRFWVQQTQAPAVR